MEPFTDNLVAYSIAEASARSSLSRATIYRRIADGSLHSIRNGGRRLIPRDALRALILGEAA